MALLIKVCTLLLDTPVLFRPHCFQCDYVSRRRNVEAAQCCCSLKEILHKSTAVCVCCRQGRHFCVASAQDKEQCRK